MRAWLWCWLAIVAAGFWMAVPAGAQSAAIQPLPARVVAIGDLHGDYAAWIDIARDAGLIDAKGKWAGGKTVLVQMGDIADRGANTLLIIKDLMRLRGEAAKAGGQVVALVGNHEAMNMTGDLRYVSAGEYSEFVTEKSRNWRDYAFKANRSTIENAYRAEDARLTDTQIREAWMKATPLGKVEHQAAWSAQGEIGKWVIGNPAVLRLGDIIFVHAGLSAAFATRPVEDINSAVAKALAARDTADDAIINDQNGPLWYRGLAGLRPDLPVPAEAAQATAAELTLVLAGQAAKQMVIGHTPVVTGIALRHDGRLAMIDTGISSVYGGKPSFLEISDGRFIPHVVARSVPDKGVTK